MMDRNDADPMEPLALLRLLQLASPAFPVGTYAYSNGLEQAVDWGFVRNEPTLERWISGIVLHALGCVEVPLFARMRQAWSAGDQDRAIRWMQFLSACRESSELLLQERRLGQALARVLSDLGVDRARAFVTHEDTTYTGMFALGAFTFGVPLVPSAQALLFSWIENQVTCATRLFPLGQTAAQRVLSNTMVHVPEIIATGLTLSDEEIGGACAGLAIASSGHETQYCRLFRS